jgi:hypothetical protein
MAMHHTLTSSIRHTIDLIYLEFKNSIHVKQLTQNEINHIVIFQISIYYQKLIVIQLFYAHINDLLINKIFSANDFFLNVTMKRNGMSIENVKTWFYDPKFNHKICSYWSRYNAYIKYEHFKGSHCKDNIS